MQPMPINIKLALHKVLENYFLIPFEQPMKIYSKSQILKSHIRLYNNW